MSSANSASFPRGKKQKASAPSSSSSSAAPAAPKSGSKKPKPAARKASELSDGENDDEVDVTGSGSSSPVATSTRPASKRAKTDAAPAREQPAKKGTGKKDGSRKESAATAAADDSFSILKAFTNKRAVVGVVKDIKELDVVIALPEKQFGFVSITEISPHISKLVEQYAEEGEEGDDSDNDDEAGKELPNLRKYFTKGQLVMVKVNQIHIKDGSAAKRVELTLQPKTVSHPLSSSDLKPGMFVPGSIASEQDHGLMIDLGLADSKAAGTSVFMPHSAIPAGVEYLEGQTALFKVHKVDGRVVTVHPVPSDATFESIATSNVKWPDHCIVKPFQMDLGVQRPPPPIAVGEIVRGVVLEHTPAGMMVGLVLPEDEDADGGKKAGKKGGAKAGAKKGAAGKSGADDDKKDVPQYRGLVPTHHISDITLLSPEKRFPEGSKHKFRVLNVDGMRFALTAKKTLVSSDLPIISDYARERVGTIGHGTIVTVRDNGCVVQFFNNVRAFVPISDMSHEFLKSTNDFKRGQPVKCRVFYANPDEGKMKVSFLLEDPRAEAKAAKKMEVEEKKAAAKETKKRELKSEKMIKKLDFAALNNPGGKQITAMDDLHVDMDVEGYVLNVREKAGVFVALSPTVIGRIKIAELSDDFVRDWQTLVKQGDKVKCRVTSLEGNRVELSRKSRAQVGGRNKAADADADMSSEDEESDDDEDMEVDVVDAGADVSDSDDDEDGDDEIVIDGGDDSDADDVDVVLDTNAIAKAGPKSGASGIQVTQGFSWSNSLSDDEDAGADSDSDDDDESSGAAAQADGDEADAMDVDGDGSEPSKAKLRRQKQKAKDEAERAIQQRQAALLNEPQLATDFERLLVGSPNSSFLWIKYMAFQLKLADITKARQVAERAIQTIHYREEQEKLNVWVAWLNLENQFGDRDSLEALFKRAVQYNDPKTVYLHLASIYARSDKHELAREVHNEMLSKFKDSTTVWTRFATYLFEQNQPEDARALLPRGLKSLPKSKHIATITQFALLEFKMGDAERGRTIFEGILASYPKRVDLWSVFLDMEVKSRDLDAARRLFDRIITLKFSAKKIKFFFKKYLEFEKKFGDDSRVEYVKQRAVEYVEALNRGDV
ncbi:hypothetical protein BCR44DRAFT_1402217 [Catenaria anguillulae PL171]|uniref:S1 motif domain-containing protein n=1 Tax=Catenaria anguillulae PL171 TaxID=765915 RepID=A0A1Y2HSS7_9FUNG|nr:hypothetical protein BCR44DRAFT_1402217 [Catenaria anguillulae PL171]